MQCNDRPEIKCSDQIYRMISYIRTHPKDQIKTYFEKNKPQRREILGRKAISERKFYLKYGKELNKAIFAKNKLNKFFYEAIFVENKLSNMEFPPKIQ